MTRMTPSGLPEPPPRRKRGKTKESPPPIKDESHEVNTACQEIPPQRTEKQQFITVSSADPPLPCAQVSRHSAFATASCVTSLEVKSDSTHSESARSSLADVPTSRTFGSSQGISDNTGPQVMSFKLGGPKRKTRKRSSRRKK